MSRTSGLKRRPMTISHRRRKTMAFDHDDHKDGGSRRHALERMIWASGGILCIVSGGGLRSVGPISSAQAASAMAQAKPTIPIIVKDKTSFYWKIVLAGARKAGQDLGVNVVELGADSETDISGQIRALTNAVASLPAAIIIAPAQFSLSASRSIMLPRKLRS